MQGTSARCARNHQTSQINEHTSSSLASRNTSTTTSLPAATRHQTLAATSNREQQYGGRPRVPGHISTDHTRTRTQYHRDHAFVGKTTDTSLHGDSKVPPRLTDDHARPPPPPPRGRSRPTPPSPDGEASPLPPQSALRSPPPSSQNCSQSDRPPRARHACMSLSLPRGCSGFFSCNLPPAFFAPAGERRWVFWVSSPNWS